MAKIRVQNLRKAFGAFVAVQDSNFVVEDGEFFVMLGPSGCGKTTTLRMIAGLELPTGGRILLGGEDVTMRRARERDIAFVFQLFALYPHMNVRKNIGFPLLAQGMPAAEIRSRVEETAKLLRIDHLLDKSVSGLAGGDRQRVALGRAIVRRPKCFLMDEPLGTLDTEFRDLMVHELRELHNRIHATTVYVTHDQMEAMSMADKIAVMNHGVIEQFGTPREIYDRPATMFVADFIGSPPMNLHEATVSDGRLVFSRGDSLPLPGQFKSKTAAGDKVVFGIRPDDFYPTGHGLSSGGETEVHRVELPVSITEPLGNETLVFAEFNGADWVSRMLNPRPLKAGDRIGMSFDLSRAHLFSAETGKSLRN
ncbi:MAG: ABC transporter ATP-binding protein [Mesorhizobium sp.]|nr:MAG: ABC transporter ATP-binding protein [Mesorhizobium sp.]